MTLMNFGLISCACVCVKCIFVPIKEGGGKQHAVRLAVSSALVCVLALTRVSRNCSCHTVTLFGTSHFSGTTSHLHVNGITPPLRSWHGECCARMPGSRRLWEETSELMSWALLCLFVFFTPLLFFLLKIHLVLIDHQSQCGSLRKAFKDEPRRRSKLMQHGGVLEKPRRDAFISSLINYFTFAHQVTP